MKPIKYLTVETVRYPFIPIKTYYLSLNVAGDLGRTF
jgi:hypothetical protein